MKSPVASLCFVCSSVMNLDRVIMSVTICSPPVALFPLLDILRGLVTERYIGTKSSGPNSRENTEVGMS